MDSHLERLWNTLEKVDDHAATIRVRGGKLTRAQGGRLIATGGCFDLLHAGHVSLLRRARALGDALVVCVNSDDSVRRLKGSSRPVVDARDRVEVLRALSCVDAVLVFEEGRSCPSHGPCSGWARSSSRSARCRDVRPAI
ncbi:adenylyltransferase/cytidyltransferase family protein [Nonomuraea sp. WAC 01424]|uniref:adenylyltransferase/cytidyltransferase family protein n=1 Tax=Nonomuraea sp. WAC 01424 TaxID=2203200 RepID=UPI0026861195